MKTKKKAIRTLVACGITWLPFESGVNVQQYASKHELQTERVRLIIGLMKTEKQLALNTTHP
jgi:hypothetical protein